MNSAIKTLEEIGQKASLKQHDSLTEMLAGLNVEQAHIKQINEKKIDLVCGLIPEDENDDDNNDDDTKHK